MALVETRDREALSAFFRRDPALHAYSLGDLDDFFWPHTRWWAWDRGQGFEQVALLYSEPDVPVLLLLETEPEGSATPFADALMPVLPERIYAHVSPSLLRQFEAFRTTIDPVPHLKLSQRNLRSLEAIDDPRVSHLTPADLVEVEAFYAGAYPGTWFEPRMLETNRYLGIREDGRLLC
ncbi:MAG: GNAT family N-acetyltransferase, partial [Gaiella sp.]